MLFRIARSRDGGSITHYDLYKVDVKKGMTVLDALFQIQNFMDPSLSFRYSCRGAVCGSCAMLINKVPRLACRTQIIGISESDVQLRPFKALSEIPQGWHPENEVLVEPLPNMPIIKDLVVDMASFFKILKDSKLWFESSAGDTISLQSPEDRKKINRYVNCILCGLCYGSCPVNASSSKYIGPAALAKSWRFYQDSRVNNPQRYIEVALSAEGAPMCDLVMNCVRVCPKDVAPGGAIRKMKNISKNK